MTVVVMKILKAVAAAGAVDALCWTAIVPGTAAMIWIAAMCGTMPDECKQDEETMVMTKRWEEMVGEAKPMRRTLRVISIDLFEMNMAKMVGPAMKEDVVEMMWARKRMIL